MLSEFSPGGARCKGERRHREIDRERHRNSKKKERKREGPLCNLRPNGFQMSTAALLGSNMQHSDNLRSPSQFRDVDRPPFSDRGP